MSTEEHKSIKNICCIGLDYVGGPVMTVIAENCPDIAVTVVDTNVDLVNAWSLGPLPFEEPRLEATVEKLRGKNLFFSTNIRTSIEKADLIFIAKGAPTKTSGDGAGLAFDLTAVEEASKMIGQYSKSNKIVIIKSTVTVGYSQQLAEIMKANSTGNYDFTVISNPEFMSEGVALKYLYTPDHVVIGYDLTDEGKQAAEILKRIYSKWIPEDKILILSVWSAELVKLATNTILAQRVSSINAISMLCEKAGADVGEVSRALGMDSRIGPKFLNASVGFGGKMTKDVSNLAYLSGLYGLSEIADYWTSIIRINELQRQQFFNRVLTDMFNSLLNKRIAVLGFAYKAMTSFTTESSSISIIQRLLEEGANVAVFDPQVKEQQIYKDLKAKSALITDSILVKHVRVCESSYEACKAADAILILTEWPEFRNLDFGRIYGNMNRPAFVFDGRNILDRKKLTDIGFRVYSIGICPHEND